METLQANQYCLNFTIIIKDDINTLMYIHPIQFCAVALYDVITLSYVYVNTDNNWIKRLGKIQNGSNVLRSLRG